MTLNDRVRKIPQPLANMILNRDKPLTSFGIKNIIPIDVITTELDTELASKINLKKDTIDDLFIKAGLYTWYFIMFQNISKKKKQQYIDSKEDFDNENHGLEFQFNVLYVGVFQVISDIPELFESIRDKIRYWPTKPK